MIEERCEYIIERDEREREKERERETERETEERGVVFISAISSAAFTRT